MALTEVFAAIQDAFPDKSVKWSGPDSIRHHSSFPRIAWEPVNGSFSKSERMQGRGQDAGDIWSRQVRCAVTLWHRTIPEVEALMWELLNVLYTNNSHFSAGLESETWEIGGDTTSGKACILGVVIRMPIPRTKPVSVTLESIEITSTSMTES
jgi:hypothetical protein